MPWHVCSQIVSWYILEMSWSRWYALLYRMIFAYHRFFCVIGKPTYVHVHVTYIFWSSNSYILSSNENAYVLLVMRFRLLNREWPWRKEAKIACAIITTGSVAYKSSVLIKAQAGFVSFCRDLVTLASVNDIVSHYKRVRQHY